MFAVSICVPIIALAGESAGSTTAATLWSVNVPSIGREKLVISPTAQRIAGHPREASATSMIPRPVCALLAGKVSLLLNTDKLLVPLLWLLQFNWEYLRNVLLERY